MGRGPGRRAVGREHEATVLAGLLASVRAGQGGALALLGPPGTGKSLLVAEAVDAAADLRVLQVRGVESEAPLAFAALHRLLRPLRSGIEELPPRQATALRAAFGEGDLDQGGSDRFVVYLAVLSQLSNAAGDRAVLVVVDDAHWLDDASREALLFVARRVDGERVAVLLAARDDAQLDLAGLSTVSLAGLGVGATRALLSDLVGAQVPWDVADRLCAGTGGNPLALVELAGELDRETLLGKAPLPAELPLTAGVEAAFLSRYRALDADARAVLLVASADDAGDVAVVSGAAERLGAGGDALTRAEQSGLLSRSGDRLELRHPLVRSAIYGGALPADRRAAHGALAEALAATADTDRRVWHLAAAVDRPDDAVVGELESLARRADAAGGYEAASAAWERAAELTADPVGRGERFSAAAHAAWTAARPQRAAVLADAALRTLDDPVSRVRAQLLRARIEWSTGSVSSAHHRLLAEAAAVVGTEPAQARVLAMFAASLAATSHLATTGDPLAFLGDPTTPEERCTARVLAALVHISRHDWAAATSAVHAAEAAAQGLSLGLEDLLPLLGMAALHVAVDDVALALHERLLAQARDRGALLMVLYALTRRGAADFVLGRWDEIVAGAQESVALATATGRPGLVAMPRAWLALIAAARSQDDAAARLADLEAAIADGSLGTTEASVHDQLLWTRALLAETPADAVHHYEQMTHGFAERIVALDRIETAVRAGRPDLAERWLSSMTEFADGTGTPWATAVVEHCRALLADGADAQLHFTRALEHHAASPRRVDAARTELAYGEWLRRERRRVEARSHLRAAMHVFDDVGARRLANRAAEELRASGERARRRDAEAQVSLTPTELTVARLVAQGLATRDVATRLFISPRTVDFHLRNVFAKLGVTSRAELAHATLD